MTPFIGSFTVNDNILVGDPYVGQIIAECVPIEETNKQKYEINAHTGTWYTYHNYGNYRHPVSLLLIEENLSFEIDINNINPNTLVRIGSVISSFGRMITAVDKQIINNTMYTYVNENMDMVYRLKDVRNWLKDADAPRQNSEQIHQLLTDIAKSGREFVEASELSLVCNVERLPVESDLWANDCYFRLKNNPLAATVIMGGVVSKTYTDENTVYVDNTQEARIIYINLDEKASKAPRFRVI